MFRKTLAVAVLAFGLLAAPAAAAPTVIEISLGHAEVLRPAGDVTVLIIGNPAIAAASIAADNLIVLTALQLGTTNLIALDNSQREVLSAIVTVVPVDRRPSYTARVILGGIVYRFYRCGPGSVCTLIDTETAVIGDAAVVATDTAAPPVCLLPDGKPCPETGSGEAPGAEDGD